jgi:hypothetical protein
VYAWPVRVRDRYDLFLEILELCLDALCSHYHLCTITLALTLSLTHSLSLSLSLSLSHTHYHLRTITCALALLLSLSFLLLLSLLLMQTRANAEQGRAAEMKVEVILSHVQVTSHNQPCSLFSFFGGHAQFAVATASSLRLSSLQLRS